MGSCIAAGCTMLYLLMSLEMAYRLSSQSKAQPAASRQLHHIFVLEFLIVALLHHTRVFH